MTDQPRPPSSARRLFSMTILVSEVFVVLFAVFLTVAVSSALLTLRWRAWLPGAEGEQSLIGGVKSAVYTALSHII